MVKWDKKFKSKILNKCQYEDLDYDFENEIFRRAQKGEPMKKMELMRSYNYDLIQDIDENTKYYEAVLQKFGIPRTRGNHLNFYLRALIIEDNKNTNNKFVTLGTLQVEEFVKKNSFDSTKMISYYNNLKTLFDFLKNNETRLRKINILPFLLLYRLILDGELDIYEQNFISYTNDETIKKPTNYIPLNLIESYRAMKACNP